jgi:hypothetical protein
MRRRRDPWRNYWWPPTEIDGVRVNHFVATEKAQFNRYGATWWGFPRNDLGLAMNRVTDPEQLAYLERVVNHVH